MFNWLKRISDMKNTPTNEVSAPEVVTEEVVEFKNLEADSWYRDNRDGRVFRVRKLGSIWAHISYIKKDGTFTRYDSISDESDSISLSRHSLPTQTYTKIKGSLAVRLEQEYSKFVSDQEEKEANEKRIKAKNAKDVSAEIIDEFLKNRQESK
jgi:hypothetical protein